ncbi:MAG: SurA N-terminal domain-containing protein [Armatimonadetes bacterium]|nr:SurA N-terminal domain-containing protein [Armatimonadota bacterium]
MGIYKLRTELGHYFKWILLGVLVPIFVIGGMFAFNQGGMPTGRGPRSDVDSEVIAKVNGLDITRGELEGSWLRTLEQINQSGGQSLLMLAQYRGMIFQQMVQSKVMLAAAEQGGVDISDATVDEEITKAVTVFLKNDRKSILGKLTKQEEAVDPRDDSNYRSELAKLDPPSSVGDRERAAISMIPRDQVRAQLAQQGLVKKIQDSAKRVTDADVKASYNVYKLTRIAVVGAAREQLKTKADKIVAEAKGGADFKALAKTANAGGPFAKSGSQVVYSFNTRNEVIPAVRDAAEKMKPGDVSPAIDLDSAYIVFKLDEVVPKLPAKMDKKTLDERKKQIEQERQTAASTEFQQKITKARKVEVIDPEMKGYWLLSEAMTNPAKSVMLRKAAEASFKAALKKKENNIYASAQLATLYFEDGNYKDTETLLNGLLNAAHTGESAEMRKMFGDVQVKLNKNKDAVVNYKIAGEIARNNNPAVMKQLIAAYKGIGRTDLANEMVAQKADYDKRKAAFEAMQKKQPAAPNTAPKQ